MSGYPNVFISHASEDKQRFVLGFAARLRRAGIDAWVDQWEISPGDSLVHRIFEEGIAQADVFVIVLSETSIEKAWVQEELNAAVVRRIEGKLRTIIAVLIDDVEVPVALQSLVWVRISNLGQYDSEFQQVVAAIGGGRDRPSLGSPLARVASSSTRSTHPVGELPPGIRPGQLPPFHLLGAYVFQELCRDLLDAEPEVAFCNIYGTSGQAQEGVDLLAHRQLMDGVDLGQCKCYRTFTAPRIRAASEEFLSHWERWAHERPRRFILFVACELSERKCQQEIARQRQRFAQHGLEYQVWDASTLRSRLRPRPEIVASYLKPDDYWVQEICGGSYYSPQSEAATQAASTRLLAAQFDRLAAAWSEDIEIHIEEFRNRWREGRPQVTEEWITQLKSDQTQWLSLGPGVQAKVLRLEAALAVELHSDFRRATVLADEAARLTPGIDDSRIRAIIEYRQGQRDAAIDLLHDTKDPEALQFLAGALIESGRLAEAEPILYAHAFPDALGPETHRLRALLHLAQKDVTKAQLEIQKAVEGAPGWRSVRLVQVVVDYFSALSPAVLPDELVAWPPPVEWTFVRSDADSLRRLREAEAILLAHATHLGPVDATVPVEIWRLACLANDPERQDQANDLCKRILVNNPVDSRALLWGIARRYDIDMDSSRRALEEYSRSGSADIPAVLALVACYMAGKQHGEARRLLNDNRSLFEQGAEDLFHFHMTQVAASLGDMNTALAEAGRVRDRQAARIATAAAWSVAAGRGAGSARRTQLLRELFEETRSGEWLYEYCHALAQEGHWPEIASYTDQLVGLVQTGEALRLAAVAAHESRRYEQCLQLLSHHSDLFPDATLPADLRRLKLSAQAQLGITSPALEEATRLAGSEPNSENVLALARISLRVGDFTGLRQVVRRAQRRQRLPDETALQLAAMLDLDDRVLATELWRSAIAGDLADEYYPLVLDLGFRLGLEREMHDLWPKIEKLMARGLSGFRVFTLGELAAYGRQWNQQANELIERYQMGELPVHILAAHLNQSLAEIYHRQLLQNERSNNPAEQRAVFVRSGSRGFEEHKHLPTWRLHLDLTALLLAYHLGILKLVEASFAPLHIPAATQAVLLEMRRRAGHPQPDRLERHRTISELAAAGRLAVMEETGPHTVLAPGADVLGAERAALLTTAMDRSGYLLTFLPVRNEDLDHSEVELSGSVQRYIISSRAIIDALHDRGVLTDRAYQEALVDLGQEAAIPASSSLPLLGSTLICHANVLDVLAGTRILPLVCHHFRVQMQKSALQEIENELRAVERSRDIEAWLEGLQTHIAQGLEDGLYRLIPEVNEPGEPADPLGDEVLRSVLAFAPEPEDAVWIDDRYLTHFRYREGNVPLLGLNDVLHALHASNKINDDDYFGIIAKMRAGNLRFIPPDAGELLYHLRSAQVTDGRVQETPALALLRRYFAGCVLQGANLRKPASSAVALQDHAELPFVFALTHSLEEALRELWSEAALGETLEAQSDWLIENIYLDHLGMLRLLEWRGTQHETYFMVGLGLAALTVQAFLVPGSTKTGEPSRRRVYLRWLSEKVLNYQLDADLALIPATAYRLKDLLLGIRNDLMAAHSEDVATAVLQQFYDDIPKALRDELWRDAEFMHMAGREPLQVVDVAGVMFEVGAFRRAAFEAVNGRPGPVEALEPEGRTTFQPSEDLLPGFTFRHPGSNAAVSVRDDVLGLLSDSPSTREEILRRNPQWFDCSTSCSEAAIVRIAAMSEPAERLEAAEATKAASAEEYYIELLGRLARHERFQLSDLLPPSPDAWLRHLRLTAAPSNGITFRQQLELAAVDLLKTVGLVETFDRISGFPVQLPETFCQAAVALGSSARRDFVKALCQRCVSPLGRIHLAHLLLRFGIDEPKYRRLATMTMLALLSDTGQEDLAGLLVILRWTYGEIAWWPGATSWTSPMRASFAWSHAHRLFTGFSVAGASTAWLKGVFGRPVHLPEALFRRDLSFESDVASPKNMGPLSLLVSGLGYIAKADVGFLPGEETRMRVLARVHEHSGDLQLPAVELLLCPGLMTDALGSFLAADRGVALERFLEPIQAHRLSNEALRVLAEEVVLALQQDPSLATTWVPLPAILANVQIFEDLRAQLAEVLLHTDYVSLWTQDEALAAAIIQMASVQVVFSQDTQLAENVWKAVVGIFQRLATRGDPALIAELRKNSPSTKLSLAVQSLFETMLNVANAATQPQEVVRRFGRLILEAVQAWPDLGSVFLPLVSSLCRRLPVELGQEMWPVLVRLRAT